MKKIIILIAVIFITGCTKYTELNDLNIINTLGINYSDNYNIYLSTTDNTLSSSNKNLNECFNDIYLSSNKQIYLSHINLLILTEEAINNKLDEILNYFLNDNNFRNNFYVVIMSNNDMQEFFKENIKSEDITNLLSINKKETSTTNTLELEELIKELLIDNNYYIPTIALENNKISIKGYTLIKDKKVYKNIDINESIILNILTNNFNKLYLDNLIIYEGNSSIKYNNNTITITINITSNTNNIDILYKEINKFLDKYKNDYDILKINDIVKKKNYHYYLSHQDMYKSDYKVIINNKKKENYIKGNNYEQ